jgi:hypothetical protein
VIARLNFTALGSGAPLYSLSKVKLWNARAQRVNLFQVTFSGALR